MDIINWVSNDNSTGDCGKWEGIELSRVIFNQNYFHYKAKHHTQKTGLAVGPPASSVMSDVYWQYLEHSNIVDILIKYEMTICFRYVDDKIVVHSVTFTNALKFWMNSLKFTLT